MAAFNTVHRSHTCFKFPGPQSTRRLHGAGQNELSVHAVSELWRSMWSRYSIQSHGFGGRSPDSISLRNKMNVFSSLYSSGRHPQTCSIRKFDGPQDNFKRKILGSSVRKRFSRSLSRCPPSWRLKPHLRRRSSEVVGIMNYLLL
jgi:hypothetical protein